ncbi:MAG: nucleotidyltransferase family protein [Bacteroidota bacterium]|nr:nucleotidyltransferase family protein [Bacteroidota bacterium]
MNTSIYGVILAAGESIRMGSPKALLQIKGKTFLQHLVATLRNAGLHEISVVLGHDSDKIIAQLPDLKIDFVINENYQKGQLSSIQVAIKSAPNDCDAIMICPIDRPLISSELIKKLIEAYSKTKPPIVVPIFDAKRGHPIIFSSSLFSELMRAPHDIGARAVVWAHHNEVIEVPTGEEGILINVDTPEIFEKYINQMNIE